MRLKKEFLFLAAAAVLAPAWYLALLIPGMTRSMLRSVGPLHGILALCAAAVVFAPLLKRWVIQHRDPEESAFMGLGIALAGAVVFVWVLVLREPLYSSGGAPPTPLGDWIFGMGIATIGTVLTIIVKAFYVVIPMGLLTIYAMRMVGDRLWPELRVRES